MFLAIKMRAFAELNSLKWYCFCMLNWIVWNRTVYLYKMYLALINLQSLICHKTQTTNQSDHKNATLCSEQIQEAELHGHLPLIS